MIILSALAFIALFAALAWYGWGRCDDEICYEGASGDWPASRYGRDQG